MSCNYGRLAEWSIAVLLKSIDCNRSVGSNPTSSAKEKFFDILKTKKTNMETTSFILGMLTIIGVAAAILLVIGMVKIYKQKSMIANLQGQLDFVQQQSYTAVQTLENEMHRNLDELRREYSSYVDSRIDKLQSKKEVPIK